MAFVPLMDEKLAHMLTHQLLCHDVDENTVLVYLYHGPKILLAHGGVFREDGEHAKLLSVNLDARIWAFVVQRFCRHDSALGGKHPL